MIKEICYLRIKIISFNMLIHLFYEFYVIKSKQTNQKNNK